MNRKAIINHIMSKIDIEKAQILFTQKRGKYLISVRVSIRKISSYNLTSKSTTKYIYSIDFQAFFQQRREATDFLI